MNSERDLYSRIYANSQDSVFLVSSDFGKIVFANSRAVEDTSYELLDLENMEFRLLFLAEEASAIDTLLQTTLQWNSGIDPQRTLRRKSGKKLIVEITSLAIEFEGKKAISCSVRDITARVRAEEKIKDYSQELEKINIELEDRVKARTHELDLANGQLTQTNQLILLQKKELEDVMNNIQQAIFTVNQALKINPDYSQFAVEVFGSKPIAGAYLIDFLFMPEERETKGKNVKDWLEVIFSRPEVWDACKDFGVKELIYSRTVEGGAPTLRNLKFEWRPIFEGEVILKFMVVCWDITQQKILEALILQKEAEHREELELISRLIHLSFEIVDQFVGDFDRNLELGRKVLAKDPSSMGEESCRILLHSLHTIKGTARQLGVGSVDRRAHLLESRVVAAMKASFFEVNLNDFHSELSLEFKLIEKKVIDIVAIYHKITQGKNKEEKNSLGKSVSLPLSKFDAVIKSFFSGPKPISSEFARKALGLLVQLPISNLFDRLEQLAMSLALELGYEVKIERLGDDLQVDCRVMDLLHDGFLHAVRNSLDHGGDRPEVREAAGLNRYLTLLLKSQILDDGSMSVEIADDGKGIDPEVVKSKALKKGLVDEQTLSHLSLNEVLCLVFMPGFSSREVVGSISGRGFGLDILKEIAENGLGGKICLESTLGKGSRIQVSFEQDFFIRNSTHCYGCFSLDKSEQLSRAYNLTIDNLVGLEKTVLDRPLITDLDGLIEVQKNRQNFDLGNSDLGKKLILLEELDPKVILQGAILERGVRHWVSMRNNWSPYYFQTTLKKLDGQLKWGLKTYLSANAKMQTVKLSNYTEKNKIIQDLTRFVSKVRGFSYLSEAVSVIADEMIMNAMFDAPRDELGKPKYNHLPRKGELVLKPHEEAFFSYGVDDQFIGLSIEDPFGALTADTLIRYLLKGYRKDGAQVSQGAGGAGLGLFMIFDQSHCVVVHSNPGHRTEMVALIGLGRSYQEYSDAGKCFSFFVEDANEADKSPA